MGYEEGWKTFKGGFLKKLKFQILGVEPCIKLYKKKIVKIW